MKKKVKLKISPKQFFGSKNRRDKRGSHIDVVISFVIFIVFLGFLYSIIAPATIAEDREAVLNYLEKAVKEELSANLTSASVKIFPSYKTCYQILEIIDSENLNVTIKDDEGTLVKFELVKVADVDYIKIDGTPEDGEELKRDFKIYYSEEELEKVPLGEENCLEQSDYLLDSVESPQKQVGLLRTEKYVFETKVLAVFTNRTKYVEVKESLDLPYGSEFTYGFTFSDGTILEPEKKEVEKDTYVRAIPVKYVDKNANINSGFINIKVW